MGETHLTPEIARHIIETVGGSGIPPEYGFQFFSVGLESYLKVIEDEYLTSYIRDGGAAFKMVIGMYGGGKTHFLYSIREIAWKHNYVVSYFPLSPDRTPFHRLDLVYAAIAANLIYPQEPSELIGGYERGIDSLIKRWFMDMVRRYREAGIPDERMRRELNTYVSSLGGYQSTSFRNAVRHAFLALLDKRDEDFNNIVQWLKGEGYDRAIHRRYGILQKIDKSSAFQMIRSLIEWVRDIGYTGLVVLMDEAERIPSMSSRQRESLLNNLRELIDECGHTGFRNAMFFYAVPDDSFLEGRAQIYEALRQRLSTVFDEELNPTGVRIDLEKAEVDPVLDLNQIGMKLARIYETAYGLRLPRRELAETVLNIARGAYNRRYGDVGYKRLFVQKVIQGFHKLRTSGEAVSAEEVGL
ncbi:hypothetical protein DRP77_03295 [Candidatus Poribacteria bacterium]|nr:MAG: hypothetical protein DRP77_03295 [Candidatus Poribacteria bacterium]